jgi:glycogen debranching enzyme
MEKKDESYRKAIWIIEKCATKDGFFAAYPGYDMVFGRDSMIISLGASLIDNKILKNAFRESLITLGENQSKKGQIPNAVDKFVKSRKAHVDYQSIDSTLWYLIGHKIYQKRYNENKLLNDEKDKIERALNWLSYLDIGEDGMPEQLPTTDWQDAFPHRYGHTINTQALYYHVLQIYGKKEEAKKLKKAVNEVEDVKLWNGEFYSSWRWKNHNKYHEEGKWFDSLGNLLAIIYGLADDKKSEKILSYIKKNKIDFPYPIKSIYPTIKEGSKDWQDYYKDCAAKDPWSYLNGGIWTYIGGFYILALIKMKKFDEAKRQLDKLGEANMKNNGNFSEWMHGLTGEVGKSEAGVESYQGWNAGMYIMAYECLEKKRILI